ncbi:MAG: molecular chaperone TorD family protein [Alphaproteobacteria bacterium]|nr:molecular chaperone TorD family protein [Alphaproteobacteria bacterium]
MNVLTDFHRALAQDLALLARMTSGELDRPLLEWLRVSRFPESLALDLRGETASSAYERLGEAVVLLPKFGEQEGREELSADYAGLFLTDGYGVQAIETSWIEAHPGEEILTVAKVEAWYRLHGYTVFDRLNRPADTLAFELGFLAHLLDGPENEGGEMVLQARLFLQQHPLCWVPRFAQKAAGVSKTSFYSALSQVLGVYLESLDDALRQAGGDSLSVLA